eukprot:SAG31_NODE_14235_length_819_cov_1.133333_1_plen_186_part_10
MMVCRLLLAAAVLELASHTRAQYEVASWLAPTQRAPQHVPALWQQGATAVQNRTPKNEQPATPALKSDGDLATAGRWSGGLWPLPSSVSPPATPTDAVVLDRSFVFDAQPASMDEAGVLKRALARFKPRLFQWGAPTGDTPAAVAGSVGPLVSATVVVAHRHVQLGPDIDERYTITVSQCSVGSSP